jgi:DNA-binding beta-propeller fold protein YncE
VQHLSANGKPITDWQMHDYARGKPVGLTVGPDGNLWIPDTHYNRVLVVTPKGEEIRRFGERGTDPGKFDLPTDVSFDKAGNIYVSEYGDNNRIQVFDPSFNFLRTFGSLGPDDGQLSRPQSIAIVDDLIYISDSCNHRIAVFKLDGTFVRNFGGPGSAPGEFRFPYGLELDKDNNLLIAEFGNSRVQKIDRLTGQSLSLWGRNGRLPGELSYPWAIVPTNDGRAVVLDAGNNRLQVMRFR